MLPKHHSLWQKVVQNFCQLHNVPPGIIPQINHQGPCALRHQGIYLFFEAVRRSRVKVRQLDVSDVILQHLSGCGRVLKASPGTTHVQSGSILPQDSQGYGAPLLPANQLRSILPLVSRNGNAVHRDNDIPGYNSRRLGGTALRHRLNQQALLPLL